MPPNAVTSAASVCDTYPIPLDAAALPATWNAAGLLLGRTAPTGLLPELMAAWSEPHRHYHDQRHLGECMALWTRWREHCSRAGEVAIALWFHDAIYDPRDAGNELNSAGWAARSLTRAGADSDTVQRVHDLVMTTQHGAPATTVFEQDGPNPEGSNVDERLLVDIDLAILGSSAERFERYDQDVRKEYAWVQGYGYQEARAQVLRSFLHRPRLYHTKVAVAPLERPARTNLAAALSRLAQ